MRYGIGVGRPGFTWSGEHAVSSKKEWPDWMPPKEMLERQPYLPQFMAGGPNNPLGARALYLGSTLYRIHGSNEPWTIGQNVSSGCIRMRNADVIDLYSRVKVGAKVLVSRMSLARRRRRLNRRRRHRRHRRSRRRIGHVGTVVRFEQAGAAAAADIVHSRIARQVAAGRIAIPRRP